MLKRTARALALFVVAALVSAASLCCVPPGQDETNGATEPRQNPPPPSLLDQFDTTGLLIPRDSMLPGGPGKDGIPSLTDPKTTTANEVTFLKPDDRVVGVTLNGESRAYALLILNWHEAVNDTVGRTPIAVVYCPLCDSASVVDRRVGERTLTFGISGLLYNSNVLLYDRETNGLWSQLGLRAVSGPLAGTTLKHLPWELTTFADWQARHPNGTVLTPETGHQRDYDRNPYGSYFGHEGLMFPVEGEDVRLPKKAAVVGIRLGDIARAYSVDAVAKVGRIEDTIGGERVVLEADAKTGGVTVVEVPAEAQVVHTFWFAWVAFHPDSELHTPADVE